MPAFGDFDAPPAVPQAMQMRSGFEDGHCESGTLANATPKPRPHPFLPALSRHLDARLRTKTVLVPAHKRFLGRIDRRRGQRPHLWAMHTSLAPGISTPKRLIQGDERHMTCRDHNVVLTGIICSSKPIFSCCGAAPWGGAIRAEKLGHTHFWCFLVPHNTPDRGRWR